MSADQGSVVLGEHLGATNRESGVLLRECNDLVQHGLAKGVGVGNHCAANLGNVPQLIGADLGNGYFVLAPDSVFQRPDGAAFLLERTDTGQIDHQM